MKRIIITISIMLFIFVLVSCDKSNNSEYKTVLFSEGLACITDKRTGKSGYINKKFEVVIDCIYNVAYGFNDGLAIVKTYDGMVLINTKGKEVTEYYDEITYDYNNKVYIAINKNPESISYMPKDDYYLLDKNGTVIGHYREIKKFNKYNYAVVITLDIQRQFINNKGEVLVSGVLKNLSYGYSIAEDAEGVWTLDEKLNKIHNFGDDIDWLGSTITYKENSSFCMDIYGNNLGDLRGKLEKEGQILSILYEKDYLIVRYSNQKIIFYNILNGTKIVENESIEYKIIEDHILLIKDNNLLVYNNSLELKDKVEIPYDCKFRENETKDFYRKDIYLYILDNNTKKVFTYKFDYDKSKIKKDDYLNQYNLVYFSKDYICVEKNNEVGLITLKGEVYFDCAYKHLVVTDDGYIISNNVVYNKRKKIIYESSQYLINYFSYPEEYYFNWD